MSLVRIEMMKGQSTEYKKTLLDCIHEGLMESVGIEDWEVSRRNETDQSAYSSQNDSDSGSLVLIPNILNRIFILVLNSLTISIVSFVTR